MIPFAKTKSEHLANNDPRLALEEPHTDHAGYVSAVGQAAIESASQGFLRHANAEKLIAAPNASNVLKYPAWNGRIGPVLLTALK